MSEMSLSDLIKLTEIPLLVRFTAVWCAPCRAMKPVLQDMAGDWDGDVDFWEVDVDEDPDTAVSWSIRSIPTLVLIDENGDELGRLIGLQTRKSIEDMLLLHFEEEE